MLPHQCFRQWRHELGPLIFINGIKGGVFTCLLDNQGDRARLTHGINDNRLFYDAVESVVMHLTYMGNNCFIFILTIHVDENEKNDGNQMMHARLSKSRVYVDL